MKVPFVDLVAQYHRYKAEIDLAIQSTLESSAFIGGAAVKEFDEAFARYTGTQYSVGCANGTDSMEMLLDALGVSAGDEIIVPALSWISTAEVIGTRKAVPVFVDIDETYTIDPERIEERITPKTKGIIPVHLYGCPANMKRIMEIADKHNLFVIEDCAQAHGAKYNGQNVSTFGIAGSFSFYPGKNLGAYGDAGAVVTNNEELAKTVRMMANHGQPEKHVHLIQGRNSRLDGLQAAVLNAKLPHLKQWTAERQANARYYNSVLEGSGVALPLNPTDREHVFHLYVVQSEKRDALIAYLAQHGIGAAVHYPTPMPHMPCFAHLNYKKGEFPIAESVCDRIVSIPMFAELSEEQMNYVASTIRSFHG